MHLFRKESPLLESLKKCTKINLGQYVIKDGQFQLFVAKPKLKEGFSIQFFVLRQRPRTSLQCFALEHSLYKAKHCRDVLGRCLRTKNQIQNRSLRKYIVIQTQINCSSSIVCIYSMYHVVPLQRKKYETRLQYSTLYFSRKLSKLYVPSTLNIDLILWHTPC